MKLSKEEIQNILALLERTTVKGNEVPTFNRLVSKLISGLKDAEEYNVTTNNQKGGTTSSVVAINSEGSVNIVE